MKYLACFLTVLAFLACNTTAPEPVITFTVPDSLHGMVLFHNVAALAGLSSAQASKCTANDGAHIAYDTAGLTYMAYDSVVVPFTITCP